MDTAPRCPHCGGTHKLMEICSEAPNAVELLRQYIHGERSATHVLAVGGMVILTVLWAFAITMGLVWGF